ncbi:hypothetical protein G7046_g2098 [Stylonectria norvegica]|nr:hypothetical protein G7046_g2098 [Stylonectria norvegica]
MTQPYTQPDLTPQLCFSSGTLRDFLRLSRSSIDDSIAQNLNALVTPSRSGFDPSSTSQRTSRPASRPVDPKACQGFKEQVLFPSWQARTEVLNYCALVAASPDPDDPSRTLRELETQKDRDRVVDERLDPYSGRFFPREARTERLASLVRQERGVENIVRHRTWTVIKERSGEPTDNWEDAHDKEEMDIMTHCLGGRAEHRAAGEDGFVYMSDDVTFIAFSIRYTAEEGEGVIKVKVTPPPGDKQATNAPKICRWVQDSLVSLLSTSSANARTYLELRSQVSEVRQVSRAYDVTPPRKPTLCLSLSFAGHRWRRIVKPLSLPSSPRAPRSAFRAQFSRQKLHHFDRSPTPTPKPELDLRNHLRR